MESRQPSAVSFQSEGWSKDSFFEGLAIVLPALGPRP